ncbi:nuclear valosin-containing protein-like isoform X2 [Odontomachus brunneus]|uniref:nuclear valosin-containing protein-like isoform X2 n=1 Tax=Odontomachus brunneus TaxID=486640 RepID=UPI0013F1F5BA|nr:nuclear valosin-containing protein-like isoform X2 [Odontomachus brunneus]
MDQRLFRDQSLITRVQTYMRENENKVYIDVNDMADTLQKRYKDYRNKKRGAFRAMSDSQQDPTDIMLLQMYKKVPFKQNGNSNDKELIDISSDDDMSKSEPKVEKDTDEAELPHDKTEEAEPKKLAYNKTVHITPSVTLKLELPATKPQSSQIPAVSANGTVKPTPSESIKKRQRAKDDNPSAAKKSKTVPVTELKVTFSNIGTSEKVLKTVCTLLAHMKHPEIFKQLGISPPRGFLLHGPPGCGKTLLAHAVAGELNMPLLKVAAPELIAGVSGESEARIRELFDQALALVPCVVFLDEIDAIAPHRATAQREMERRIVAQLLSCLDELNLKENGDRVLVIGATNRPDSLDPALRRAGRFDREVCLGIPDSEARTKILAVHTKNVILAPDVNLKTIASLTPGFVGADLVALIREAAMAAVDRIFEDLKKLKAEEKLPEVPEVKNEPSKESQSPENSGNLADTGGETNNPMNVDTDLKEESIDSPLNMDKDVANQQQHILSDLTSLLTWLRTEPPLSSEHLSTLCIEHSDFEVALRVVQPSAKREGFATVPDVTWDDVGSLHDIRQELQKAILAPVRYPEYFSALGLTAPTGLLLCGPPGCGKTLLAKAVANEAGINFISVKGPELLNMYVGESEKAVRQCFLRARNSAPCVIFFDELDALCPKRTESDHSATSRVVNQMLTEMDGVEGRQGVFLMAASNRPDIIDPAVLRPGRLDKILYVGLPTASERIDILCALTKNKTKPKLDTDVDLNEVGHKAKGFTGADLAALIREAGMEALMHAIEIDCRDQQPQISMRHIALAFEKVQPSVREKDIKHYEKLSKLYSVKKSPETTPMEMPTDTPITDVVMEPMEI